MDHSTSCWLLLFTIPLAWAGLVACVTGGGNTETQAPWSYLDAGSGQWAAGQGDQSQQWSGVAVALQDDASIALSDLMWVMVGRNKTGAGPRDARGETPPFLSVSSDGRNWTLVARETLPLTGFLYDVIYSTAQSLFVVVGCCGPSHNGAYQGNNTLMYSENGASWVGGGAPFCGRGDAIAYSTQQDLYVMVGSDDMDDMPTNYIKYSRTVDRKVDWMLATFSTTTQPAHLQALAFNIPTNEWLTVALNTAPNIFISACPGPQSNLCFCPTSQVLFTEAQLQTVAASQGRILVGGALNKTDAGNSSVFGVSADGGQTFTADSYVASQLTVVNGIYFSSLASQWILVGHSAALAGASVMASTNASALAFQAPVANTLNDTQCIVCRAELILPIATNVPAVVGSSAVVRINDTASLATNASIQGDLTVIGTLNLTAGAMLNVEGVLSVVGTLSSAFDVTSSVTGLLVLNPGSTLVLVPGCTTNGLAVIANYSALVGQFSSYSVIDSEGSGCSTAGPLNYGPTSLTVQLTSSCTCGQASDFGGLSPGAIAGIAVGSIVGGLLLGVGIVTITVHLRNHRSAALRQNVLSRSAGVAVEL